MTGTEDVSLEDFLLSDITLFDEDYYRQTKKQKMDNYVSICLKYNLNIRSNFYKNYKITQDEIISLFESQLISSEFLEKANNDEYGIYFFLCGVLLFHQGNYQESFNFYYKSLSLSCIEAYYDLCLHDNSKISIFILTDSQRDAFYKKLMLYSNDYTLCFIWTVKLLMKKLKTTDKNSKEYSSIKLWINRNLENGVEHREGSCYFVLILMNLGVTPLSKSYQYFLLARSHNIVIVYNNEEEFNNLSIEIYNFKKESETEKLMLDIKIFHFFKTYSIIPDLENLFASI